MFGSVNSGQTSAHSFVFDLNPSLTSSLSLCLAIFPKCHFRLETPLEGSSAPVTKLCRLSGGVSAGGPSSHSHVRSHLWLGTSTGTALLRARSRVQSRALARTPRLDADTHIQAREQHGPSRRVMGKKKIERRQVTGQRRRVGSRRRRRLESGASEGGTVDAPGGTL